MRKPNYNMERKDRERAKQAKATAKAEKRAAKTSENAQTTVAGTHGDEGLRDGEAATSKG